MARELVYRSTTVTAVAARLRLRTEFWGAVPVLSPELSGVFTLCSSSVENAALNDLKLHRTQ